MSAFGAQTPRQPHWTRAKERTDGLLPAKRRVTVEMAVETRVILIRCGSSDWHEQGKLVGGDPLLTSVTIWSAIHGVANVVLMGAPVGRKREDLLIHSVVTSVLRGLAPPGSPTPEILERLARR